MSAINNVNIYGLEESIAASGYPMSIEIMNLIDLKKANEKDYQRANKLANTSIGSGHDQFLTSIIVELQRYHFIDFCSSMSTMHRISKMDLNKSCNQYVDKKILDLLQELIYNYNENPTNENFYKVIYNIPSGFEYTARLTTNYRQLKTIYAQRKNHRLPDWHIFCKWIEELPHSDWIIGDTK